MVDLRATYLGGVSLFNVYAKQPFCDLPDSPPIPMCAQRTVVIRINNLSHEISAKLDATDKIIDAGGVADVSITDLKNLVTNFTTQVKTARGE